jgi:hypothetical protein
MPDQSTVLGLPYIMPAQAQKHVTHNEALRVVDAILHLGVQSRTLNDPPETPPDGARWIVPAAATGAWAGAGGKIALREYGYWSFFEPQAGWQAHVADENVTMVFDGSDWAQAHLGDARADQLGIATAPDAVNRLAVAADATLLTHAGAGHQLKLNKAQPTDTASLLFQTEWTGHAEMGLAGDNQFSIKVSPNGSSWTTALLVDAATGDLTLERARLANGTLAAPALSFASQTNLGLFRASTSVLAVSVNGTERARFTTGGMQVTGTISGTAVTQGNADSTIGRLLKVGDFGLGLTSAPSFMDSFTSLSDAIPCGFWRIGSGDYGSGLGQSSGSTMMTVGWNGDNWSRLVFDGGGSSVHNPGQIWLGSKNFGTVKPWARVVHNRNALGSVSQDGAIPTGAMFQRGASASGAFERRASGWMDCTRTDLTAASVDTAEGALFRSADITWTFPSAFMADSVPVVHVTASQADVIGFSIVAISNTAVSFRIRSIAAITSSVVLHASATGRWSTMS